MVEYAGSASCAVLRGNRMRVEQIDLKIVRLPLVRPFRPTRAAKCTSITSWFGSSPTVWSAGESARAPPIPITVPRPPRLAGISSTIFSARSCSGANGPRSTTSWLSIAWSKEMHSPGPESRWRVGMPGSRGKQTALVAAGFDPHRGPFGRQPRNRIANRDPARAESRSPIWARAPPDQAQDRPGMGHRRRAAGPAHAFPKSRSSRCQFGLHSQ